MTEEIKNLSASIRARLNNLAKKKNQPFQQILLHYGMERFLYRLSKSNHSENFILKGGLYFLLHDIPARRFTRDIDLLGFTEFSEAEIKDVISSICILEVVSDGLIFDPTTIQVDSIRAPADHEGFRIKFLGYLGSARIHMQLDLGYRDEIHLTPERMTYPTLLDMESPIILVYPPESVIAEKFQAMVFLGEVNSRMKDFYDIWLLSKHRRFDGKTLQKSIEETFRNRNTPFPSSTPTAFNDNFSKNKQGIWKHFMDNLTVDVSIPEDFSTLTNDIKSFLMPVIESLTQNIVFDKSWVPDTGWY